MLRAAVTLASVDMLAETHNALCSEGVKLQSIKYYIAYVSREFGGSIFF